MCKDNLENVFLTIDEKMNYTPAINVGENATKIWTSYYNDKPSSFFVFWDANILCV